MKKLSPERQAEYDAMGLPWSNDHVSDTFYIDNNRSSSISFGDDSYKDEMVFATKAANVFHQQEQTIEDLTGKAGES